MFFRTNRWKKIFFIIIFIVCTIFIFQRIPITANAQEVYSQYEVVPKELYERCDCFYENGRFCGWSWETTDGIDVTHGQEEEPRFILDGKKVYFWKSCWAQGKCARNGPKHQPEHWWCKITYSLDPSGKPDTKIWEGRVNPY